MLSISKQREKIQARLKKCYDDLATLQGNCEHPNVGKVARADTGNYCKQDDRYWYDCKCPDCGKTWMEDQ